MKSKNVTTLQWYPYQSPSLCHIGIWNAYLSAMYVTSEGGRTGKLTLYFHEHGQRSLSFDFRMKLRDLFRSHTGFHCALHFDDMVIDEKTTKMEVDFLVGKEGFCVSAIELANEVMYLLQPSLVRWFAQGELKRETFVKVKGKWVNYRDLLFEPYELPQARA